MPLAPGQELSFYTLLAPLGAGGMGEVWRARDNRLGREVAIKVLPESFAGDEERLRRFEREARAGGPQPPERGPDSRHRPGGGHVLPGARAGRGRGPAQRLARGPLPVEEALDVCRQIAEGLGAAHDAGVVHRDLKPANVRRTPEGAVKVLDFGLARQAGGRAGDGMRTPKPDSFFHGGGPGARHADLHEPRAGARQARRSPHGRVGLRLRALRFDALLARAGR